MLVLGYGSVDLDPAKIADDSEKTAEYIDTKMEELFSKKIVGKLASDRAVLGIPTARTFARTFNLPTNKIANLNTAVNLEAEQYIPMPVESLYIDHQIIKKTDQLTTVLMAAVPQKMIDSLLKTTAASHIDVAMIEPGMNAIARLLERTEEGRLPTVIVDIGPASTDVAILDGAIRVTGGLSIGGNTLTLDIAKRMDVPLETAHQLKVLSGLSAGPRQAKITHALTPSLSKISGEIQKVMRYYTDRFPEEQKIEQVLIVGSGSNVPGLGEFFTNDLVMPARVASPWQAINFGSLPHPNKSLRPRFMTAAGLALVKPEEIWQ